MKTLYARISDSSHAWIATLAARSGLPMSVITETVIDEARRRGWQIEANGVRITDTGDGPATSSPAPVPRDQGQAPPPHAREPGPPDDEPWVLR